MPANIQPLGGLDANPNIAIWLGALLGEFAIIEFLIIKLMATVLADDIRMRTAWVIMGRIRSIPDRCSILKDAAQESRLSQVMKNQIIEFADQITELNAMRNKYVHGMYHHNSDTRQVWIQTWTMTISRKTEKFEITAESVKADVMKIRKLNNAILSWLPPLELEEDIKSDG